MGTICKYILLSISILSAANCELTNLNPEDKNQFKSVYCQKISNLIDSLDENQKAKQRKEEEIVQLYLEDNKKYVACIEYSRVSDLYEHIRFLELNKLLAKQLVSYNDHGKGIVKRDLLLNKIQSDFLYLAQNTNYTVELNMLCMTYGYIYRETNLAAQKDDKKIYFLSKKNLIALLIKYKNHFISIIKESKKHTTNRKKLMAQYLNEYFSELLNLIESGEETRIFFDKIDKDIESASLADMIKEGTDDSISKMTSWGLMLSFRSISSISQCVEYP